MAMNQSKKSNQERENYTMIKKFTAYWLDGVKEILEGKDAKDAFIRAGYSGGALQALDFFSNGENNDYEWINGKWVKTPDIKKIE